jgi:hypothetical protein
MARMEVPLSKHKVGDKWLSLSMSCFEWVNDQVVVYNCHKSRRQ